MHRFALATIRIVQRVHTAGGSDSRRERQHGEGRGEGAMQAQVCIAGDIRSGMERVATRLAREEDDDDEEMEEE